MRTNVYWIDSGTPGRLGVSPRPRGGDWLADEVRAWRDSGVNVVVSLLTPSEVAEFELESEAHRCEREGIEFRSLPIPDRGVPPVEADASAVSERLASDLLSGRSVVVHCRQGIGRAALMAAAGLAVLGSDVDTALQSIEVARGRPVPDTAEQRAWVARFAATRGATSGLA